MPLLVRSGELDLTAGSSDYDTFVEETWRLRIVVFDCSYAGNEYCSAYQLTLHPYLQHSPLFAEDSEVPLLPGSSELQYKVLV